MESPPLHSACESGQAENALGRFCDSVGLSEKWPKAFIKYAEEEAIFGEYGESLENLIAIGLENGIGFEEQQVREIQFLAAEMDMMDSPWVMQLLHNGSRLPPS